MIEKLVEVDALQELWSGYGQILRMREKENSSKTYIAKRINFPTETNHPRGWNTNRSHKRKVKSYEVEFNWYKKWSDKCSTECYVPKYFHSSNTERGQILILEDLDAIGFSLRYSTLDVQGAKLVLRWLANFHATFMSENPIDLWEEGTYWHLGTRPDEWEQMVEGELKQNAAKIAKCLSGSTYSTLVHGDAKVANFCFSECMEKVAAVDFQYIGGGCGMKDVAYFLGSCLSELECEKSEKELLDCYFDELKIALLLKDRAFPFRELEQEWRGLYVFAWADFTRFLLGWMPTHKKLNNYSKSMVQQALNLLQ